MDNTRRGFLKFFGLAAPAVAIAPMEMLVERPVHFHEKRTFNFNEGHLVVNKEECRDPKCKKPILDVRATPDSWDVNPDEQWEQLTKARMDLWPPTPVVTFNKRGDRVDEFGNKMFKTKWES